MGLPAFAGLLWSKQLYNLEDAGGRNVFEGGFLGLDNIGPIDRSHLPVGGVLEQSDATGWMAFYAIAMAGIAGVLQRSGRQPAVDLVIKFLEHFAAISDAMDDQGLRDDTDGLYYDRLLTPDGTAVSLKYRSMVGIIPVLSAAVTDEAWVAQALTVGKQFADLLHRQGLDDSAKLREQGLVRGEPGQRQLLLSVVSIGRLERIFARLFDQAEFLSPYGLRALSASVLERYYRFLGDEFAIEYPTGSGHRVPLDLIALGLQDRLIALFVVGPDGRRPCFGWVDRLQHDPAWKDNLLFNEYFHGDNGAGLGASHQTGWTGLIADVIRRRHGAVRSVDETIRGLAQDQS